MAADLYGMSASGSDVRRLVPLAFDDLAIAWSPDGTWLAASGPMGLVLVRVGDGTIRQVTQAPSFGAIDWR